MALGGVDTGSMKPSDDAKATATATGTGLMPSDTAVLMDMEPIRLMAAVCEVISDMSRVITQKQVMNIHSDGVLPSISLMPPPSQSESPVV